MIETISLLNFKSHKKTTLNLKKINIFIGPNNSGKSSIGEALAIIKQNFLVHSFISGPLINLPASQVKSLIHNYHSEGVIDEKNNCKIEINGKIKWDWITHYEKLEDSSFNLKMELDSQNYHISIKYDFFNEIKYHLFGDYTHGGSGGSNFNIFSGNEELRIPANIDVNRPNNKFIYRDYTPIQEIQNKMTMKLFEQYANLKPNQSLPLSQSYLQIFQSMYLFEELREKPKTSYDLRKQGYEDITFIESIKLEEIFSTALYDNNLKIQIQDYIKEIFYDEDIQFEIKIEENYKIRPIIKRKHYTYNLSNEGSGFQQILFLLLRNEFIPNKSTMFMNEPECYIDVNRQHKLVDYLINQCIRKQHQLILSTHSEHILFGLIKLVKEGIISPEDVGIFAFGLSQEEGIPQTIVKNIEFNSNGDINELPGFFEVSERESQISLQERSKLSKNK